MKESAILWYVDKYQFSIHRCRLEPKKLGNVIRIRHIDDDGNEANHTTFINSKDLFSDKEEAEDRLGFLKYLYKIVFDYKPYVGEQRLLKHLHQFQQIQNKINNELYFYENFNGIDFCDVSASGVQIRGHHDKVKGVVYGEQITIPYDSNEINAYVDEFVDMWKRHDRSERVEAYKGYVEDGEKYGWN